LSSPGYHSRDFELTLDSLAFGGEAVGRASDGRVVFVAGGAPGDRVRVRLVEEKRKFARGELVAILEPGAARVTPPCALADRCGGCPWMHVSVAAQLAAKQAIVERALRATGCTVAPIAAAPQSLAYRTRARLTARAGRIGFAARRSHDIVDIPHCPALDPTLDAALQRARQAIGPRLGDESTLAGWLVRDALGQPAVHLALQPGLTTSARELNQAAASLVGQAAIAKVTLTSMPFAQANAAQNETLRRLVREAARADGARVLELYAGDGNFTRDLAAVAAAGVAVEGDAAAVARLREKVRHPHWELSAEPVARAVERLLRLQQQFEVVVLDPPRAGAAEAIAGVARLGAARLVYVSCDPMTLARDVQALMPLGYRARQAWPVDMMPHTFHVEVVCLIERD
jgi:23S rRNA (uracil1939-C5)-methyltransferase